MSRDVLRGGGLAQDRSWDRLSEIQVPSPDFALSFEGPTSTPVVFADGKKLYPMMFFMEHVLTEMENIVTSPASPVGGSSLLGSSHVDQSRRIPSRGPVQTDRPSPDSRQVRRAGSSDANLSGQPSRSEPFSLWVNPSEFQKSFSKVISDDWTRGGHVNEYWGEDQVPLTLSGTTPAFYTAETGLTRVNRRGSGAYLNLMALVAIFNNNSYRFDPMDRRRIWSVGDVLIQYDGWVFRGSFDSFQLGEQDTSPYWMTYSIGFTCRDIPVVGGRPHATTPPRSSPGGG